MICILFLDFVRFAIQGPRGLFTVYLERALEVLRRREESITFGKNKNTTAEKFTSGGKLISSCLLV